MTSIISPASSASPASEENSVSREAPPSLGSSEFLTSLRSRWEREEPSFQEAAQQQDLYSQLFSEHSSGIPDDLLLALSSASPSSFFGQGTQGVYGQVMALGNGMFLLLSPAVAARMNVDPDYAREILAKVENWFWTQQAQGGMGEVYSLCVVNDRGEIDSMSRSWSTDLPDSKKRGSQRNQNKEYWDKRIRRQRMLDELYWKHRFEVERLFQEYYMAQLEKERLIHRLDDQKDAQEDAANRQEGRS